MVAPRDRIKIALPLLGITAGGVLGWLALRDVAWGSLAGALADLDWRLLPLALSAVLFAASLKAYRFRLLLSSEKVSTARLFCVTGAGNAANSLSPVRILPEATQTLILTRGDGLKLSKVVSGIIVSRLFDLLVTVNLVGAGLILLPQLSGFKPIVVPLWGVAGAALLVFLLFGRGLYRIAAVRLVRPFEKTLQCMGAAREQGKLLMLCIALTSVAWMSIGVAAWLVAHAAGIDLPFWLMSIIIVAVISFSGAMPAPPGAVGIYEFVAVSTLGLFAVDPQAALIFAVAMHALLFLPPLIIGIPVLALERRSVQGLWFLRRRKLQPGLASV